MGCTYSACWPRRGQSDDEALRLPPYSGSNVLSELGQWKERVRQIKHLEEEQKSSGRSRRQLRRRRRETTNSDLLDSNSNIYDSARSASNHSQSATPYPKRSLSGFLNTFGLKWRGGFDATSIEDSSKVLAAVSASTGPLTPEQAALRSQSFHLDRRNSFDAAGKATVREIRQSRAEALARRASEPSAIFEETYLSRVLNPPYEAQRQATLDVLGVTRGEANEPLYRGTVQLAAKIFKVPYAALIFFDKDKVWYKAVHSSFADSENVTWPELPRHMVLASHILLVDKQKAMVVEDVMQDARFLDLIIYRMGVGSPYKFPNVAFLGVAPLLAPNGYVVGALEICDSQPRNLDAGAFNLLINLAEMAVRSLLRDIDLDISELPPSISHMNTPRHSLEKTTSLPRNAEELNQNGSDRRSGQFSDPEDSDLWLRGRSALERGIIMCSAEWDFLDGEILHVNTIFMELTGIAVEDALKKKLKDVLAFTGYSQDQYQLLRQAVSQVQQMRAEASLHSDPERKFKVEVRSAKAELLDELMPAIGVPNFVELCAQREHYRYCFIVFRDPSTVVKSAPQMPNPFANHMPTLAFAAVADDEPWAARECVSQDSRSMSINTSSEPRSERSRPVAVRQSVQLPHNIEIFDEVTLGPLLGRGSFGRVHRGFWKGHLVAVKIMETFKRGSLDIAEVEDLAEARLVEEMQHEYIVRTYDHGTRVKHFSHGSSVKFSGSSPMQSDASSQCDLAQSGFVLETWLLLEYCDKGSLQDAIDQGWLRTDPSRAKGKPDLRTILAVGGQIARGLEYLHRRRVLHSDLTPGNVLLKECHSSPHGFTVKIADFGLSRPTSSRTINTQTYGTVTHMPPELLSDGMLTKAADVYAFGVLLWSMLSGEPAWQGLRRTQVMFKVTTQKATLPTPPGCPSFYKDLLDRCMARDYRARPQMSELAELLESLLYLVDSDVDLDGVHWSMKLDSRCFTTGPMLNVETCIPKTVKPEDMEFGALPSDGRPLCPSHKVEEEEGPLDEEELPTKADEVVEPVESVQQAVELSSGARISIKAGRSSRPSSTPASPKKAGPGGGSAPVSPKTHRSGPTQLSRHSSLLLETL